MKYEIIKDGNKIEKNISIPFKHSVINYKSIKRKENNTMGKKRNKKKREKNNLIRFWQISSKSVQMLDSGKIKFKKDEKIDISPYIETSVGDAKISRLDGIPSKEAIIIDSSENYRLDSTINNYSVVKAIELMSDINTTEYQTLILPMSKKKASKLEDNDIINWLASVSTFGTVMNQLAKAWDDLNEDDKTEYTNVLYIPKIYIFLENKGKFRKKPIIINLLITAFPSKDNAKSGIESIDEIDYTNRIINDTIEASIKCGCKSLVINPYEMPALEEDVHYTAQYWKGCLERQRSIENIKSVTFSIDNDELYVIFCKNK